VLIVPLIQRAKKPIALCCFFAKSQTANRLFAPLKGVKERIALCRFFGERKERERIFTVL